STHPLLLHSFPTRRSSDLVPSLLRKMSGKTAYEAEILKAIAVMRSFQFFKFIWQINVVPYWEAKISDINFDALAQHYGYNIYLRSEEHTSELQSRFDLVCR